MIFTAPPPTVPYEDDKISLPSPPPTTPKALTLSAPTPAIQFA